MATVPDSRHGVFLSYAHVDDEPLAGMTRGWVSAFAENLRKRLVQKIGRSEWLSFWMDHAVRGSAPLTPQLLEQVAGAATMVAVLSPSYAASEWCTREREHFLRAAGHDATGRLFVVEKESLVDGRRPAAFDDLKGFRFWVLDDRGRPRTLGWPQARFEDTEYWLQIDDVACEIADSLRRLQEGSAPSHLSRSSVAPGLSEVAPPKDFNRPTVFLAETTDDLELERCNVRRFLDQHGFHVVPDTWYSQDPERFRSAARSDLAHADLFVQLLGPLAGKRPPDLPEGYIEAQRDLAVACGKPIAQWRDPAVELDKIEDAQHRALVDGPMVRSEPLEAFKHHLRERLTLPAPAPDRPSAFVFVDMDSADRPLAEQICAILDRHGVGYVLPIETADPGEIDRDLKQNLEDCDGLVVVYGCATAAWVRQRLRNSLKVRALAQRGHALRSLVGECPPEPKVPLGIKLPLMSVVDWHGGVREEDVQRFIDELRGAT